MGPTATKQIHGGVGRQFAPASEIQRINKQHNAAKALTRTHQFATWTHGGAGASGAVYFWCARVLQMLHVDSKVKQKCDVSDKNH